MNLTLIENEIIEAISDLIVEEIKVGTARSGNRGHVGRPGHIGGSGVGGGVEPVGIFDKSDDELTAIEKKQETFDKDIYRKQLEVNDFTTGGRYEKVAKEYYATDDLSHVFTQGIIQESIENSNNNTTDGNVSTLLRKVHKFDSQNVLYEKLKDDKDFNKLVEDNFRLSDTMTTGEVTRMGIRQLVDQWASTSGDTDPKAVAMQIAADELFGTGAEMKYLTDQFRTDDWKKDPLGDEFKFNPGRKAFLQAQYEATQDYLNKAGIKEVIVYRGHEGKRSKLDGGNSVEVNMQPLSSFSTSSKIAMGFAVTGPLYSNVKPSVIASVVPAKRIFALPNTGIGCTGEREVVVLGGKMKATVIAGSNKIVRVFEDGQTISSASDLKRNITVATNLEYSSTPVLSSILSGKAIKKDLPNLDEDLENADWTKMTWDLPEYGTPKFNEFLSSSGMTLAKFKELPVYQWLIKKESKVGKEIGLGLIFKGGVGSGIRGHRTFREVKGQMQKNLKGIAEGTAKRTAVDGNISASNIKDVVKNMRNEADLYTPYLAPDTAVRMRDFISSYESILNEGTSNKEFKGIKAKDLDDFGIDSVRKMVHQEIESNRQSYTDHGIRHLEGNTQRQLELLDQMGNPTAMDKLSALAIMVNHDMGYTIKSVREGANPGGGVHQTASGKMFDEQKDQWNKDKLFTEKQFDRVSEAIKTHDSSEMGSDNLLNSTRISDNLALFAKEKLPSMFKYVKDGSSDLVQMGDAAAKNDSVAFELVRKSLHDKIDSSKLHENLKRDLKAGTNTITHMTPKFSLGVLAGEISSIKGDKKGKILVEIQYSAWDSFLQNHFDMGQKQTKKFLGDYGIKDFTKTDYDIGGHLKLKVIGARKKEIGLGMVFKHAQHDQSTHGNRHSRSLGSKDPVTQDDKNLKVALNQISQMMKMNKRPEGWQNSSGYELVEKDGKFFTSTSLPEGIRSGKTKECYRNAAQLALDYPDKYTYCEGFSTSFGIPMSHAWVVDNKTGKVVDPTWSEKNKLSPGKSYFGIPFSDTYLRETILKTEVWGIIPDYPTASHNPLKDGFPPDVFHKKSAVEKIDYDSIKDKPKDKVNYHYIEDYLIGGNIKGPQGKIFLQSEMKGCMTEEDEGLVTKSDEMTPDKWISAWKNDPHFGRSLKPSPLAKEFLDLLQEDKVVLEIGCGNGRDSIYLQQHGCKVSAIDLSPDAISLARKNDKEGRVNFEVGDAEELRYEDKLFDGVYSLSVLHSTNMEKSIPEIARVLKSGGVFLAYLYHTTTFPKRMGGETTVVAFKKDILESLFKKNGFKKKDSWEFEVDDTSDKEEPHIHEVVVYIMNKK